MFFLLTDDSVPSVALDKAMEMAGKAAAQPVSWWGALFTLGSLTCIFFVVKIMIQNQRESIKMLLDMVKEKDTHINKLNDRLIDFLENKNRNNDPLKTK